MEKNILILSLSRLGREVASFGQTLFSNHCFFGPRCLFKSFRFYSQILLTLSLSKGNWIKNRRLRILICPKGAIQMKAVHEYIPMVTQFVVAEEISFFICIFVYYMDIKHGCNSDAIPIKGADMKNVQSQLPSQVLLSDFIRYPPGQEHLNPP